VRLSGLAARLFGPMGQIQESLDPMEEEASQTGWSTPLLIGSFCASFVFACTLLLVIGHYGLNAPKSLWPLGSSGISNSTLVDIESAFTPFMVSRSGTYLKAQVGEAANPTAGQDFSFLVWFKLRKSPGVGEALGLVGKFDSQIEGKPGYAISLEGAPDGIRPRVYLSTGIAHGRWYSFSSYPMNRRDWYLLQVSLVGDSFVSVHLARAFSKEPALFLGGHPIGSGGLPQSKADVVVGAFGASRFRGQIGPIAILSGRSISEHFAAYLEAFQADPGVVPARIPKDAIRLWGSPLEDIGPRKVQIVRIEGEVLNDSVKKGQTGRTAQPRSATLTKRIAPPKKNVKRSAKVKR
jgi:hypothetical protein